MKAPRVPEEKGRRRLTNSESLSAYIHVCFILTPANAEEMTMRLILSRQIAKSEV